MQAVKEEYELKQMKDMTAARKRWEALVFFISLFIVILLLQEFYIQSFIFVDYTKAEVGALVFCGIKKLIFDVHIVLRCVNGVKNGSKGDLSVKLFHYHPKKKKEKEKTTLPDIKLPRVQFLINFM